MTTFTSTNHQNKARPFIDALLDSGYELRELRQTADLLLIDHDAPIHEYRNLIDFHRERGAKIILTPHGANPNLQWDGIWEPQPADAVIVPAEGHKAVMQAYGYPYPIHVVGWPWTVVNVPRATDGMRVLFAPIHPDGDDQLPQKEQAANAHVYRELLELNIDLTVRYLGHLKSNGLWQTEGVTFRRGVYDNSHADILNADIVVTSGTYGYLSVALGRPTVMYWQGLGTVETQTGEPVHYDEYKHLLEYPLDALRMGTSPALDAARTWPPDALKWREQLIGKPFDREAFLDVVDGVLAVNESTVDVYMPGMG